MDNFKLQVSAGSDFSTTAEQAKAIAIEQGRNVEFVFNDKTIVVSHLTNVDALYRDYSNSWLMGWDTVGPHCPETYSPEVQAEYETKMAEQDARRAREMEEYRAKEKREKLAFEESVKGVSLAFAEGGEAEWNDGREKNKDPYGNAVYDYAEGWAKKMQVELDKGRTVAECADECQNGLGFLGITGFQYGCAVGVLSRVWKHGESLRKWHNKQYGVSEDKEGVVNPAIITVGAVE